jgi:uncharacterized protein (TIGR02246 family)
MHKNKSREGRGRCRRIAAMSLAAIGLLTIGLIACHADAGRLSRGDADAIRAVKEQFTQRAVAGDWNSWIDTLTADAVVMPADRRLRGRDAILAWARSMPRLSSFAAAVDEVRGTGDLAYASGSYLITVTAADGTSSLEQGSFIDILRKQSDGHWRIARAIWRPHTPRPITRPLVS